MATGNPIHSISLADFDIQIGNTLSQTYPSEVCLSDGIVQRNLNDLCFPDGAHEAQKDTVYAVLDREDGSHLFAVACYCALRTSLAQRGAVQRGLLVLCEVPLFGTIGPFVHELLDWWIKGNQPAPQSPSSGDSEWIDVASHIPPPIQPRRTSREMDRRFLACLYNTLAEGFANISDQDRYFAVPVCFRASSFLRRDGGILQEGDTDPGSSFVLQSELTAPCLPDLLSSPCPATLSDSLGYGCGLQPLVRIFNTNIAKIYTALLNRQTVCFVGHGRAHEVGCCVLACCHLVRPVKLHARHLVPYFTVTDASKIEGLDFCIAGSTNPFYADPSRNQWAALICNVETGCLVSNATINPPRAVIRLVQHVVQGVVRENRTEAWVRNFFEWNTARLVKDALQGSGWFDKGLPPLAEAEHFTEEEIERCIKAAEDITSTMTKCHEVNKNKAAIHNTWFTTMLDILTPVAERSEEHQKELLQQIAELELEEELKAFEDVTVSACGCRTERAAVAQLAYEESKTRLLLTELRERVYLLIDSLNQRNQRALTDDENQTFCDVFNTPEYQLYNITQQVLLYSTPCTFALKHDEGGQGIMKATGRVWVSKNYIAFQTSWLSRLKKGKDKAQAVEVIPFDVVTHVEREQAVVSDGVRVGLSGVSLYIGNLGDSYKLLTLLQALTEKQKRVQRLLGALDPVLSVSGDSSDNPSLITKRIVIPCGLYLYDRKVTEDIWELQRYYPIAGWSAKLMPTDPPAFCDRSGRYERRFGGKNAVTLPEGWKWVNEWTPVGPWCFSSDFKKGGWKETRGTLDMCRRRQWQRIRVLEWDVHGTLLPEMVMPVHPILNSPAPSPRPGGSPPLPPSSTAKTPNTSFQSQGDQSEEGGRQAPRCRQAPRPPHSISPGLNSTSLRPSAVLPGSVASLGLKDFTPPGDYNPFHRSSEPPGCGSHEVASEIGCGERLLTAEDALLAETHGLSPKKSRRSMNTADLRNGMKQLKQDWHELKADLKNSFSRSSTSDTFTRPGRSPVHSRGVIVMDGKSTTPTSPKPTRRPKLGLNRLPKTESGNYEGEDEVQSPATCCDTVSGADDVDAAEDAAFPVEAPGVVDKVTTGPPHVHHDPSIPEHPPPPLS